MFYMKRIRITTYKNLNGFNLIKDTLVKPWALYNEKTGRIYTDADYDYGELRELLYNLHEKHEEDVNDIENDHNNCWEAFDYRINVGRPDKLMPNEIWYTTTNNEIIDINNIITPDGIIASSFGDAIVQSNIYYEKGYGCITFDKDVISLDDYSFSGVNTFETIDLPSSLKIIGKYAFSESSLENIKLPNFVDDIYDYAFYNCKNLKYINIPENITILDEGLFKKCSSLKSISWNEKLSIIGKSVFAESGITKISIPDTVSQIYENAFLLCTELTSITLPNMLMLVGDQIFGGCKNLNNVVIPNNLLALSNGMFINCTSLSNITLNNSLISINDAAFQGCKNLETIALPLSLQFIKKYAFNNSGLKSIILPGGLKTIETKAFANTQIEGIEIPEFVDTLYLSAFDGCEKLTVIQYKGTYEQWLSIIKDDLSLENIVLICADKFIKL